MIKLKIAATPIAGENVEELKHLNLACGNVKWFSHFGKQFGNSLKTKHAVIILLNSCTLGHLLQRNDNTFTQHPLLDCYSSFIHNSSKRETIPMSFKGD